MPLPRRHPRAFTSWRLTTPAARQLALFRLADALADHAEEFADLESRTTGKPRATLVRTRIDQSVDQLRFFAVGAARDLDGRAGPAEYAEGSRRTCAASPSRRGAVTPWNYPLNWRSGRSPPAIAAGNTVVLKPSARRRRRRPCGWPSSPRSSSRRRAQRRPRRPRDRAGARGAPHPAARRHHRVRARGHAGRRVGGAAGQARAPRARRQGARDRLSRTPTWMPRTTAGSRRRRSSMRGRTARPRPGCWCTRRCTTPSSSV